MAKFLLIVFAVLVAVYAEQEFYRLPIKYRDLSVQEDVMLDPDNKYAIVTIEDANKVPGHKNSINLHDLEMGYTAVKDVDTGVCYVYHSRHSLGELRTGISDIKEGNGRHEMKDYNWDCSNSPITNEELEATAGKKIANFCRDYQAIIVDRREILPFRRLKRAKAAEKYFCILCFGGCNGTPKEKEKISG